MVTNYTAFEFLYSPLYGLGYGFCYMGPIYLSWIYWPDHKGLITSLAWSIETVSGGCTPFIVNYMLNPDKVSPNEQGDIPADEYNQFEKEIANKLPETLYTFGYIILAFNILIFMIIPGYPIKVPPKKADEEDL